MTERAKLALLASRIRADDRRILAALERRGIGYEQVDTRTLHSGLGGRRWAVVLNREVGSVRARYAAWTLEAEGSWVLNSAHAIDVCSDKWRTSLALRAAGLPTPRTAIAMTPAATLTALEELGYPAVLKPVTGSRGQLVTKLESPSEAAMVLEYLAALTGPQAHLGYVQALVASPDARHIRVIVIGGEAVGASYQLRTGWRTSVATGGRSIRCDLSPELAKLAVAAADSVAAELAGVDVIEEADGRQLVLEVNAGVEFSGFQQAHDEVDVADRIVEYLVPALADAC
ncbi:MAG TPA: RimK family alpha-L-glutamate ligase [Jatrophihabitans sp.]|jgi:[lysine-biosynthesis-protein LysW]--L-2-aminoadipate ligase|nr:RimK family alpha-L-glutamate ligase [Jatrophihabitans sp.]